MREPQILPPLTPEEEAKCAERDGFGVYRFGCGYTGHDCAFWQAVSFYRGDRRRSKPLPVGDSFNAIDRAVWEANERRAARRQKMQEREVVNAR